MSYGKLKTITLALALVTSTSGLAFAQDSSSSTANVNVGVGVTASNTSNSKRSAPGLAGLPGGGDCNPGGFTVSLPGGGIGIAGRANACNRGKLAIEAGRSGTIHPDDAEILFFEAQADMGSDYAKQREAAFKARAAARAPTTAGKAAANLPDSIKLDITGVGKVKIVDQAAIAAYYSCDVIRVQGARVRQPGCSS